MTTLVIAASSVDAVSSTLHVMVSQVTEYVQIVITSTQDGVAAVITASKTSALTVKIMGAKGIGSHSIGLQYGATGIVGLTVLGFLAAFLYPGPITGFFPPICLTLWWVAYRATERQRI